MNRSMNAVSVIEVATENSNNQSNRSISPVTDSETERLRSAAYEAAVRLYILERDKKPVVDDYSVAQTDAVEFKMKMKTILSCKICTELRRCPMFQCKYGHLICAGCLNDILSESRVQNEIASCPECQTTITKDFCFRNVAVEKTISELAFTCPYCSREFTPANFKCHNFACGKRPATCTNVYIGCEWKGPQMDKVAHERQCTQPSASGYEILKAVEALDRRQSAGHDMYNRIMELLSVEKVSYTDIQLKQVKTENKNIFYESSKFSACDNQWMIQAYCPADVSKNISYQLSVKSKLISSLCLKYLILKGPYNDMDIRPYVYKFIFSGEREESTYQNLEISSTIDREKFSTSKRIDIRLFMFMAR